MSSFFKMIQHVHEQLALNPHWLVVLSIDEALNGFMQKDGAALLEFAKSVKKPKLAVLTVNARTGEAEMTQATALFEDGRWHALTAEAEAEIGLPAFGDGSAQCQVSWTDALPDSPYDVVRESESSKAQSSTIVAMMQYLALQNIAEKQTFFLMLDGETMLARDMPELISLVRFGCERFDSDSGMLTLTQYVEEPSAVIITATAEYRNGMWIGMTAKSCPPPGADPASPGAAPMHFVDWDKACPDSPIAGMR